MPTPILDRERPVPGAAPAESGPRAVFLTTFVLTLLVLVGSFGPFPAIRNWVTDYLEWFTTGIARAGVVGTLLAFPVAMYACIAIHELEAMTAVPA